MARKRTKKWYAPKHHTGWKATDSATTRRRKVMAANKKAGWSLYRRYLTSARQLQALANVTTSTKTKRLAASDAKYFYAKAKATKK